MSNVICNIREIQKHIAWYNLFTIFKERQKERKQNKKKINDNNKNKNRFWNKERKKK